MILLRQRMLRKICMYQDEFDFDTQSKILTKTIMNYINYHIIECGKIDETDYFNTHLLYTLFKNILIKIQPFMFKIKQKYIYGKNKISYNFESIDPNIRNKIIIEISNYIRNIHIYTIFKDMVNTFSNGNFYKLYLKSTNKKIWDCFFNLTISATNIKNLLINNYCYSDIMMYIQSHHYIKTRHSGSELIVIWNKCFEHCNDDVNHAMNYETILIKLGSNVSKNTIKKIWKKRVKINREAFEIYYGIDVADIKWKEYCECKQY